MAPIGVVQPLAAPLAPAERGRLARELNNVFAPYFHSGSLSLCVIDSSGSPVYSHNAAHAVIPASTQKIIVAASALRYLGSGYRFHTQFAAATRIENGELASDLWLIGAGDPILRSDDLRAGVKTLE
ncbi:MAG: D-alanyl-D-alanine carboxypeptidase, partial [Candidatus Eremiobacteraeota bacterium]|nr:D-alanyl-D-alanine carboxypeptidase [Candidatus Eremiobacteraeota bacterium]